MCPCTHGGPSSAEGQGEHHVRSIMFQAGGFKGACEDTAHEAHYDAVSTFGDVTLYDGAVIHKGNGNTAAVDRPVLVLAFATSPKEATRRNYAGHMTELLTTLPTAATEMRKFKMAYDEIAKSEDDGDEDDASDSDVSASDVTHSAHDET